MTDDRFKVALDYFGKALARLGEAAALPEDDIVRDALIQRYEFTFEMAWKAMYRWLRARGNDVDEEAATVIPQAFALRLIEDEKAWGDARRFRNKTSHTYNVNVAIEVAAFARSVAPRLFSDLLTTLRQRTP